MLTRSSHLTSLSGIRFFAALHILLFHVAEGERVPTMAGQTPPYRLFSELPDWMSQIIARGYCSTGFFFLLSGIVLAYLYLDTAGQLTVTIRRFWLSRLARLYPFHVVVLCLLAAMILPLVSYLWWFSPESLKSVPTPTGGEPTMFGQPIPLPLYVAIGFLLNLFLVQSWFPEYALSGNFGTWALSTVAFFYLVFPWLGPWLAQQRRGTQWGVLLAAPIVSLIPSIVYMLVAEPSENLTIGSEFVFRFPPFWLGHFAMGILVTRLAGLSRHCAVTVEGALNSPALSQVRPAWGDLALLAALVVMAIPDASWSSWLGLGQWSPRFLLRHGAMAPLTLTMAFDLARGRGLLSWLMSLSWLQKLGAATYGVFILQLFFMAIAAGIAMLPLPALVRMAAIVVTTALLSWLADRYCDQPLVRRVKKWLGLASS